MCILIYYYHKKGSYTLNSLIGIYSIKPFFKKNLLFRITWMPPPFTNIILLGQGEKVNFRKVNSDELSWKIHKADPRVSVPNSRTGCFFYTTKKCQFQQAVKNYCGLNTSQLHNFCWKWHKNILLYNPSV